MWAAFHCLSMQDASIQAADPVPGVPGFKAINKSARQSGFGILVHTHHTPRSCLQDGKAALGLACKVKSTKGSK